MKIILYNERFFDVSNQKKNVIFLRLLTREKCSYR